MSLRRSERIKDKTIVQAEESNKSRREDHSEKSTSHSKDISERTEKRLESNKHSVNLEISSSISTNHITKRRQKLEIQLEFERKKKEKEQEILELELALELAKIDEQNEQNDDKSVSRNSITKVWVEKQRRMTNDEIYDPNILGETEDNIGPNNDPKFNQIMTRNCISNKLPIFCGDPIEWPYFINQYRNSTKLCGFTKAENQHRLQMCLQGKAKEIVKSLLILPQNVDKVIETLEKRFGRPEYVISLLMEKVKKFPLIKEDKLETLIEFTDEVSNLIYTLQTLNEEDHLRNPLLLQDLVNKLPTYHKMMWTKHILKMDRKCIKLIEFQNWLNIEAEAACHLQVPRNSEIFDNANRKKDFKSFKNNTTLVTINNSPNSFKRCSYCNFEKHNLNRCEKFKLLDVDKRWEFITSKGICFSCLFSGHRLPTCKYIKECGQNGCKKPHHQLLHKEKYTPKSEDTNCHISQMNNKVLLKILPVKLRGLKGSIDTYALLDDASTVSLIDNEIADKLELTGPQNPLTIQWTNDEVRQQNDSRTVSLTITGINSKSFYLRHVRTLKGMSLPRQTINMEELSKKYYYINNFKIESMNNAKPTILIGQDNWPLLVNKKVSYGPWNGPAVTKTPLGWVIHGNTTNNDDHRQFTCHIHHNIDEIDKIEEMIKNHWKLESFGIKPKSNYSISKEDVRAKKILDNTMKYIGNRYETGLLWKNDDLILPESKENAFRRLKTIENKMDKNPEYAKAYCQKIEELLQKQYIRKLTPEEATFSNSKTWYLPHFGVINPNKPTKMRIVFDAASKSHGVSLNDCLLTGPDLYKSLTSILLNFRIKKIAFVADIKEMFLQVRVRKEDQVAQRLLWRGMDRNNFPDEYEIQVVFFGSTCGPCLAQEAKNRNAERFLQTFPQAAEDIIEKHYMDDYLGGADSEEEAVNLINEVIDIHKQGGFIICNWIANNMKVLNHLNSDLIHTKKNLSVGEHNIERILGLWWNPEDDLFSFETKFHKVNEKVLYGEQRPTKRDILKIVMSIFDPLGFVGNFIIQGKVLLQEIWRTGLGWDDEVTDNLNDKWEVWFSEFKKIKDFKLPRLYTKHNVTKYTNELHIFNDASENAYASVAYLRSKNEKEINVSFICSKTRVSPLKPLTIPRLELQAALMGARLGNMLTEELKIDIQSITYYTDSQTVLHWITSEARRFKTYISHRVGEIQELTKCDNWRYVSSKENVADEATKRINQIDFTNESRWLNGPKFLHLSSENWNTYTNVIEDGEILEENLEIRNQFVAVTTINEKISVPDIQKFSKWYKLVRSTAWMLRFIKKCKKIYIDTKNSNELQPEEIQNAENLLFQKIQQDSFSNEIHCIKTKKIIPKSSRLINLSCKVDENNLLRLDGRLNNAVYLDEFVKQPIILDSRHEVTKLLIQHYHHLVNHHGRETVINNLRQKFWILNVRQAVKRAWNDCQLCKNSRVLPKIPIMGLLPSCRIEPTIRPFIKTGIDYFGPIEVTVKRSHEKRYGVIFTCMTTRAVHLEIAQDLTTNGFIHTFRQFGCRRGFPLEVYSDNGTNFKGAEIELATALQNFNQDKITEICTMKNVKWNFNPPLTPHMGGSWERLIQSIKKSLREVLKERYPQEYVLRTLLIEIENIMNSRPLTHVSLDSEDSEALTPNHFLIGKSSTALQCAITDNKDLNLLSKWKASQRLTDMFWKRWTQEYLPTLINRGKWRQQNKKIKIGDIVIIIDPNGPRNLWPKGKVVSIYPSKDGNIRIVDVKTTNGIFRRSVAKLCILEVSN